MAALLGVACSSDGDPAADPDATTGLTSDLVARGEQVCVDEPGDVTVSATAEQAPPFPVPAADILSVTSTLDGAEFTTSWELAGPPDEHTDYLIAVGLPDDVEDSFEIQVKPDGAGGWRTEILVRTEGPGSFAAIPGAVVTTTESTLDLWVPRSALRPIGADKPLLYGSSTVLRDGDTYLDAEGEPAVTPGGEPATSAADAARAFDDCVTFGPSAPE